jgi:hypothetical protein
MTFLMLPMHLWVREHRRRGCLSRWDLTQRFLIRFEHCVDHRGHLPSNPPKDPLLATIVFRPRIIGSHAREKTLVDPGPFALKGDASCSHEIEHLLHGANTSCGEPGPIKRDAGLILSGSPAKIALEFAGLLKVGDIADGSDDRCRRAFANGGDREQDLPFTTGLHDSSDFRVKAF